MNGYNALRSQFGQRGFEIAGFGCNQFASQAPGTPLELVRTFRYVRPGNNFIPDFTIYDTINVNGNQADKLFVYLKGLCPNNDGGDTMGWSDPTGFTPWYPIDKRDIFWNFGKFLVAKNGTVMYRFDPTFTPPQLGPYIETLLNAN